MHGIVSHLRAADVPSREIGGSAMAPDGPETLKAAAEHFYESCLLWEDEDLDPADHVEVLLRAFRSSDCDDFAEVLGQATGWDTVRMTWLTRHGEAGHHALVRAPDGRLLDAAGWTSRAALVRLYGAVHESVTLATGRPTGVSLGELDDDGFDEGLSRILGVIRSLPHAPYRDGWFRDLVARPVEGADVPAPVFGGPTP
jgi:hypothetical protein